MKQLPIFLILVIIIVFQIDLLAQCTGSLSINLVGSSTGNSVTSIIVTHPAPLTAIKIGEPFTLSVSATGANLTYQWRKDNINVSNAISSTYTVSAAAIDHAGNYTVLVHGDCGSDRISNTALVQIAPLPLTWLNFQVLLIELNHVQLHWTTIAEINVKHFTIERSSDGKHFTPILKPIPANNALTKNEYTATDELPLDGVNYYRIAETDFDGRRDFSQVRSINTLGADVVFKVFPNPSLSKSVLNISTNCTDSFDFILRDISGRLVYQKLNLIGNLVELNDVLLPAGVYLYEFRTTKTSSTGKIFVTN